MHRDGIAPSVNDESEVRQQKRKFCLTEVMASVSSKRRGHKDTSPSANARNEINSNVGIKTDDNAYKQSFDSSAIWTCP